MSVPSLRLSPFIGPSPLQQHRAAVRNGTAAPPAPPPLDTTPFEPMPLPAYRAKVRHDAVYGELPFSRAAISANLDIEA